VRVIVTGGAGFIGSHVADALLERGDEVVVVDNLATGRRDNVSERAGFEELDIRESAVTGIFDELRPEVCFHLAAQASVTVSVERPEYDADVNVLGTIRVLEACRRHGTHVVFSSTGGAIYGECDDGPARETSERRPLSPYGTSKLVGEEYLATYNRLYGAGHVGMRYANVFGPRQDPHGEAGVIAIFLGLLAEGGRPRIFGDGKQTRDYIYIDDVVTATLAAAERRSGIFNVGTGRETSVLELFDACRELAGSEVDAEFAPARPGELQRSFLDPGLAERELGWQPRWTFEDGLRETWKSLTG